MLKQESFASCVTHKISPVQISEANKAELSTSLVIDKFVRWRPFPHDSKRIRACTRDRINARHWRSAMFAERVPFSARAQLVSNRHVLDAADEARTHARNRSAEFDRFEPPRQLTKHRLQLEARQIRPQAVVLADAEGDVLIGITSDVQRERILENILVTIGRGIEEREHVALMDFLAMKIGVRGGRARELDHR